jgi:CHAT domain-containing protein/Tfp pilus assembly protein PilF
VLHPTTDSPDSVHRPIQFVKRLMRCMGLWFVACVLPGPLFAQRSASDLDNLEHQTLNLFNDGRIAEAMNSALKAVALAEELYSADDVKVTTSLNNLATLYEAQGQYDKAEPLLVRSLAIRTKKLGDDDPDTARAANNLAELYRAQGLAAKAEPLYAQALSIFENKFGLNNASTGSVVNNLAVLYEGQGRFSKAEPFFVRALGIREKVSGPNSTDTAGAANNLAHLYESEAMYAKAEEYYTKALDIYDRSYGGIHPVAASILSNLAQLYSGQQQFAKAEPILQRALTTFEKTKTQNGSGYAAALNNLAEIYRREGRFTLAEPLYRRAISIYDTAFGPGHPDTVTFFNNLGELYVSQGRYSDAEAVDVEARAIAEKRLGPDHPTTGLLTGNLAGVYIQRGLYAKAEPLLYRALEISRKALGPDHPTNARNADSLAVLLAAEGHLQQAREILVSDWPHRISWADNALRFGRESFRRGWITRLEDQLSILIGLQADSAALRAMGLEFVLKSKNRMSEELAVAMASRYRIDGLQDLWEQERHLELSDSTNLAAKDELKDQEDRLVAEISAHSAEFRELVSTPSLADIRSRLTGGVLVEFVKFRERLIAPLFGAISGPEHYGAYWADRTGPPGWVDLGPAESIDKLVHRYRDALSGPENRAVANAAAREIEIAVFEPIREVVPAAKEFYIAPDGLLQLISFNGLPDSQGVPLLKTFVLHTLSTGRDLVIRDPQPAVQPPIIIGIEHFGESKPGRITFPDLPGATREANEVARIVPASRRIAADRFNRRFLLEETNSPLILHLATHGFSSPDEGPGAEREALVSSGIALYGANESDEGILTAKDAAMLHLSGTQLVVLSACETGVGDTTFADGVVGLQRSLRLAGARSEILTLWPVGDDSTRELMIAFYSNLFVKRLTKFEALRQAQIALADQGVDAYDWAPFVLYGDPGRLN